MKPEIALADFHRGRDTLQIARVHNVREAVIYNMLAQRMRHHPSQAQVDRAYERSIQGDKP
jgi:hypothetical protein